jgi:hypothetical protein
MREHAVSHPMEPARELTPGGSATPRITGRVATTIPPFTISDLYS